MIIAFTLLGNHHLIAQEYSVNQMKSNVKWEGKKITGKHFGTIKFRSGALTVTENKIVGGELVIDMETIVIDDVTDEGMNQRFITHMKSADFFSVDKFNTSKMTIKKVVAKGGATHHFIADLTIKDITKEVAFDAEVAFIKNKLVATGLLSVDRTDYNIRYGSGRFFSDLGNRMIYDMFTLNFKLVADQ